MAYTALARTWRPRTFSELVGQEHVRRALVNALESGRVHHAFLFTGTRGVGKTTIARIFAKCLNCETGVTATPCGVCGACREIDTGRFIDLIEVDAASRTKVDDTRELLDNVQYSPTRGRYKVYLIDEVHMLSTHSFNALLKTLEEPPPHVKFLLATTDPQKLPVTVLSRCLQFNLKRLPVTQITERMREILEKEAIEFEPAGLRLVAQAADGSMRDGLSLLDQLIAFGGGKAGEAEARAMLGTIARDHVVRLADLLGSMNVPELLECARSLEEFAPDYAQVLDELASLFVRIAMKQAVSEFEGDELYAPEVLERLAKTIAPEDVQLFYQTAVTGRRDLSLAPDPRAGFEMTLLRMIAFRPLGLVEEPRSAASSGPSPGGGGAAAARAAAAGSASRGGGSAGTGAPGAPRASGVTGAVHAGGTLGAAAAGGSSGAPEANGPVGSSGMSGTSGAGGAAATFGAGGVPAANGPVGSSGMSGTSGVGGAAATFGAGGAPAANGPVGSSGVAGTSGAGGAAATFRAGGAPAANQPVRSSGVSGSSGAGGTLGPNAALGPRGPTGPGGAMGPNGSVGPSGAVGANGRVGASGAVGAGGNVGLGHPNNGAPAAVDRTSTTRGGAPSMGGPGSTTLTAAGADTKTGNGEGDGIAWADIVARLELGGAARQLASNCVLSGRQGGVVRLALDSRNKHMRTPAQEEKLAQALSRYFGQPVRLEFETAAGGVETPAQAEQRASSEDLEAARRAFESDPGVQGLRERFGATLLPDTVRPVK